MIPGTAREVGILSDSRQFGPFPEPFTPPFPCPDRTPAIDRSQIVSYISGITARPGNESQRRNEGVKGESMGIDAMARETSPEEAYLQRELRGFKVQAMTLARLVAKETTIPFAAIVGRSRHPNVVRARHRVWSILRHERGWSTTLIGKVFERDATTVLHGTRREVAQ